MKKSTVYFWLYTGAMGLAVGLFWVCVHFQLTNKWWTLLFLLPDALAWAGWRVRREVPEGERFRVSRELRPRANMLMESIPLLFPLGILMTLLFG